MKLLFCIKIISFTLHDSQPSQEINMFYQKFIIYSFATTLMFHLPHPYSAFSYSDLTKTLGKKTMNADKSCRTSHIMIMNGGKNKDATMSENTEEVDEIGRSSSQSDEQQILHYPTAGGMYDISEGPGHHLINVNHDKLEDVEKLKKQSVNVHEVEVDAATITMICFGTLALFLLFSGFW